MIPKSPSKIYLKKGQWMCWPVPKNAVHWVLEVLKKVRSGNHANGSNRNPRSSRPRNRPFVRHSANQSRDRRNWARLPTAQTTVEDSIIESFGGRRVVEPIIAKIFPPNQHSPKPTPTGFLENVFERLLMTGYLNYAKKQIPM